MNATTRPTLAEYLAQLNSADSQWGIWVNPENTDEYRIGQLCFEQGGLLDDWICIGSLDSLSYGFQSDSEAFECLQDYGNLQFKGKKVKFNADALYRAWVEDRLDPEFAEVLNDEISVIQKEWSRNQAEFFVSEKISGIFSNRD